MTHLTTYLMKTRMDYSNLMGRRKVKLKYHYSVLLPVLYVFICTRWVQEPIKIILLNNVSMNNLNGYKVAYEKKKQHLYSRMDDSMINKLKEIRRKTGISVSEIIRESVRRLLKEIDETGSINLKIN